MHQMSTEFDNFRYKDDKENKIMLCEVRSFSISPNSRHRTTVLSAHFWDTVWY